MNEKAPISADQKRGREEVFAAWAVNLNCTPDQFETEKAYYLNVPILEKTKETIDLELIRSQTAQLRELRKEQQLVLDNEAKLTDAINTTGKAIERLLMLKQKGDI